MKNLKKPYSLLATGAALADAHPAHEIKIQGQCYLEKFYQSFGFKTVTAPYPDWGIMHVDMVLPSEVKN